MSDPYPGDIVVRRRADDSVHLAVRPGRLRISFGLLASRDPRWLDIRDGLVIFRGTEDDGRHQVAIYRPTGIDSGPEGGWLLCEPLP